MASLSDPSSGTEYEDGRHLDANAIKTINQYWIDKEMKIREGEFTEEASGTVFCGTWNVNAKKQEGDLNEWLLHGPNDGTYADIYAVGFQEIVDLNAVNVLADNKTNKVSLFWEGQIKACLASTGVKYVHIMTQSLVGVLLCVFAKESVAAHIKDVRGTTYAVGILGIMGNKGGASIRMSLYDTSICFMCGHLAAHRDKVNDRNSDYKNILEKSVFHVEQHRDNHSGSAGGDISVVVPRYGSDLYMNSDVTIPDHDLIWFFGDFNYRIDEEYSTDEVFQKLEEGKEGLELLKARDQLNIERKIKKTVFHGFEEEDINFMPTYKYQPGTDVYDRRPEKKIRPPAWCDRILSKSSKSGSIRQHFYRRAELKPSDHKPVYAYFDVKLLKVVKDRFNKIFETLKNELEFWTDTKKMPSCTISTVGLNGDAEEKNAGSTRGEILKLNFPNLRYDTVQERKITIKNVGDSLVHWRFVTKLEDSQISKRWVSTSISKGLLKGNESVEVTIRCRIDKRTAQNINAGIESLDDLIILRIENGFDFYLGIFGTYERSCIGMSLDDLVRISGPVRNVSLPITFDKAVQFYTEEFRNDCEKIRLTGDASPAMQVPKELWRLIDALFTGGALVERDLFAQGQSDDSRSAVAMIIEALDTDSEFPSELDPHVLAEVLLTFISALPEPVFPPIFYPEQELDYSRIRSYCRRIFESSEFPTLNYNVFVYVLSFMKELIAKQCGNKLESEYAVLLIERLSLVCISTMTNLNLSIEQSKPSASPNGNNNTAASQTTKDSTVNAKPVAAGGGATNNAKKSPEPELPEKNKNSEKVKATINIFKFLLTSSAI